jgi:hypothetical protein
MAGFILAILLAFSSLGFFVMNLWKPGIQIYTKPSGWVEIANWARKNTAKEALFITPPQEVGMYQPDWRVFSERGTVVTLYDLFEIALKPDYYSIWKPRFESVAPGALGQFRGNFFENREITRKAFYLAFCFKSIEIIRNYLYYAQFFHNLHQCLYTFRIHRIPQVAISLKSTANDGSICHR